MEHGLDIVVNIECMIVLLHIKIRIRHQKILKIHHIVPYHKAAADSAPAFHKVFGFLRLFRCAVLITVKLTCIDGTQHDIYVFLAHHAFRNGLIIKIRKSRYDLIRESLRKGIDDRQHRSHHRACFFKHCGAIFTGAVIIIVVQAEIPVFLIRLGSYQLRHFFLYDRVDLRVSQAQLLRLARLIICKIFGMCFLIFLRAYKCEAGMAPSAPAFILLYIIRNGAVIFQFPVPPVLSDFILKHLSPRKIRITYGYFRFKIDRRKYRHIVIVLAHEHTLKLILKKTVNAVVNIFIVKRQNKDTSIGNLYHIAVVFDLRSIGILCKRCVPYAYKMAARKTVFIHSRE